MGMQCSNSFSKAVVMSKFTKRAQSAKFPVRRRGKMPFSIAQVK